MKLHREGLVTILIVVIMTLMLNGLTGFLFAGAPIALYILNAVCLFLLVMVLQFFRNPNRKITIDDQAILAPCDGKVVVIEEVMEEEFLKTRCRQISIFMSPLNVHVNRFPVSGTVKYVKYHPGKYLVAWHPKSSTENERTTVAVENHQGHTVLFRQIAGALARRIVYYCKTGDTAKQGEEFGFIKFGSRVDIFIPLEAVTEVSLQQVVKGGLTVLARFGKK